ncbi:hypothetical protein EXIGLDRAFT_758890 [Exidia glandulosa HHB12029]|uniref:Uncharacterized protein n=1 Tax=Exidia glandulosa HHB12029 TaxID=1314781 RepID=A0A165QFN3_EXIGL|nr:hypothetical protein EXIGLDRAFT_758890 [Exidia glandulosa HHB12029]
MSTNSGPLPCELLLEIFECVMPAMEAFYDADHIIRDWDSRGYYTDLYGNLRRASPSSTLARCARVSKIWSELATTTLYRELVISRLGRLRAVEDVMDETGDSAESEWTTDERSALLCRTLSERPDLACRVQTIQAGLGRDCDRGIRYGTLDAAVDLIALCPNVVHLDLTIGCGDDLSNPEGLALPSEDVELLGRLTQLRHLSLRDSQHIETAGELCDIPYFEAIVDLVGLWPTVETLSLQLDARNILVQPDYKWSSGRTFSHLRDLRLGYVDEDVAIAIAQHSPTLRDVSILYARAGVLSGLPNSVTNIEISYIHDSELPSISHLHRLKSFAIVGGCEATSVLDYLSQLPRTVETLTVTIDFFFGFRRDIDLIGERLQRLHALCQIIIDCENRLGHSHILELHAELTQTFAARFPRLSFVFKDRNHSWNRVPRLTPDTGGPAA